MTSPFSGAASFTIISPGEIEIGGERIFLDHGNNDELFRNKRRSDAHYMAKNLSYLQSYKEMCDTPEFNITNQMNILEIGIFSGGSTVFFDKLFKPKKIVCIDYMNETAPSLERYISEGNTDRIKSFYGTDQADKAKLVDIISKEFEGEIDLIIDDASHFYEPSRATFEATFPYLRSGGLYAIEDWSWAHNPGTEHPDHMWAGMHALTNLVFRMIMLHASDLGLIRRLGFSAGAMWAQKGATVLPQSGFVLNPYEKPRGRDVSIF